MSTGTAGGVETSPGPLVALIGRPRPGGGGPSGGLQPWPPCEHGDCRGRGDLPRAPGHADGETAARGQGDSRPPDGYGYDGATGSTAPACVVGGSELSQGLGFGSEGLFSLEWPENIRGCSLNPGSEGGPGVPFVQVETARAVTAGPRPSA